MSQRQRLKQLEKKAQSQFLAFFVLPRGLCNRTEIETQLWDDYVKNGGLYSIESVRKIVQEKGLNIQKQPSTKC
jgi:hypothetical protein